MTQKFPGGVGPLLQRDYWTVIRNCRLTPQELIDWVASRFWDFAPAHLCLFQQSDRSARPLRLDDVLDIDIRMSGRCHVRVIHRDRNSLTLGTLEGHPESGRITFGAYPNDQGDVIFHIRSRARSSTSVFYLGFLTLGEAMQTNTWTEFVNRVALSAGDGPVSLIHAETKQIPDEDPETLAGPTFLAKGA